MNTNTSTVMINSEQTFLTEKIRIGKDTNDDIWFVLKDICKSLGINNTSACKDRLKDFPGWVATTDVTDSLNRPRETTIVHEKAVTVILFKSNKPKALRFIMWVCDVVNKIRKTGQYVANPERMKILEMRKFELDMRLVQMTTSMWPDDERMKFLAKEKVASMISDQKLIGGTAPPKTVAELMEEKYKQSFIVKHRSQVGIHVSKLYRATGKVPMKTRKLVNGHDTPINLYPAESHDEIKHWIDQMFVTKPVRTLQSMWTN